MVQVIILAGGKGKRLGGDRPKTLTPVGSRPIILRLLDAVQPICPRPAIVVGHGQAEVRAALGDGCEYIVQEEQRGTGHAVQCAQSLYARREDIDRVIVLPGDHPFITTAMIERMMCSMADVPKDIVCTIATTSPPNFLRAYAPLQHFGRVLRTASGDVRSIVEYKDATDEERAIQEVNVGMYCFHPKWLWQNLDRLTDTNMAHEYYLTDLVGYAVADGQCVRAVPIERAEVGIGVNTPEELALADRLAANIDK